MLQVLLLLWEVKSHGTEISAYKGIRSVYLFLQATYSAYNIYIFPFFLRKESLTFNRVHYMAAWNKAHLQLGTTMHNCYVEVLCVGSTDQRQWAHPLPLLPCTQDILHIQAWLKLNTQFWSKVYSVYRTIILDFL